eukprot:COSAG05_NODE_20612_length_278_cov_0.575419_1_plen_43_part_01
MRPSNPRWTGELGVWQTYVLCRWDTYVPSCAASALLGHIQHAA